MVQVQTLENASNTVSSSASYNKLTAISCVLADPTDDFEGWVGRQLDV